jgi:hypothetical protein
MDLVCRRHKIILLSQVEGIKRVGYVRYKFHTFKCKYFSGLKTTRRLQYSEHQNGLFLDYLKTPSNLRYHM